MCNPESLVWRSSREIQALARSLEERAGAGANREASTRSAWSLDDASRLHALAELFPGQSIEQIVTDLLGAGLDEIAAAIPYERGPKIISRDDHGDPLYEDIGLTPRFVELTRQFKRKPSGARPDC